MSRSLKLTLCVTTFFTFARGLYVRFTVGRGLGFGGNHRVGLDIGLATRGFFVTSPPFPLRAVMMIWLFSVKTSTQAVVEQSATACVGIEKAMKSMRIINRFMCGDDKCVMRLMPLADGLTVDSCDTLRT